MEITATLAQINPTTADIEGNTEQILDELERATADGADIVVFPEMAITGYCILDLVEDDALINENQIALDRIRERTGETVVVVGFVDEDNEGKYNAAAVLQDGSIKGVVHKVLLPNYRYFDDERYFEPGEEVAPIDVEIGGRTVSLGVSVCEDLWDEGYDRKPIAELAREGADVIVNINASPFATGKRQERHELIQRHINATGLPVLYLNTVGVADVGKNVLIFDGDSLAYAADGTFLARGEQFEEDRVTVTVGGSKPTLDVPHPRSSPVRECREQELYEALVTGLRDYVRKTGFEKVIEPVSGGIDSALGLAICVDALGPENVIAFNLPSTVNTQTTKDLAEELADNFGVEYQVLPIQSIYDEIVRVYETHVESVESATAKENVYARVRGLLMMLVSNDSSEDAPAMLISNGNETEMALGYVTLYGDMSGGLNLLGDLSKMDIYAVAKYVNERHGRKLIPSETFEIRPSAELSSSQVDPFDYPTVAPIVGDLLERRWSPSDLVERFTAGELDVERYGEDNHGRTVYERYDAQAFETVVYDTYRRLTKSTFKRVQASPVVAVSRRAFGTDFREPIINKWEGKPTDWS
ncbi:NAD+ synthase (glutamine-hydrolysing) [Haladaptatus litoreus]|uniref:Glutamine-dependent NAD(+) synthetase n=1 Tax=Haladaptatus litoreus TaxID=553468 RepID=A0A1N7CNB8_9EURY|nr:NAD(+) synthase [Haladaptatus litoreus]SIR65063.1 NAD+ synthase (glutamine-hydrolysing) [Haladaptatus litoreus]